MIYKFSYEDQVYDFDDEKMSLGEARWVKRETGMVGGGFFAAARALDPDAIVALLTLAMRRAGKTEAQIEDIYSDDDNGYFKLIQSLDIETAAESEPKPKAKPRVVKTKE